MAMMTSDELIYDEMRHEVYTENYARAYAAGHTGFNAHAYVQAYEMIWDKEVKCLLENGLSIKYIHQTVEDIRVALSSASGGATV